MYVYGSYIDEVLYMYDVSGGNNFYVHDHLYSPVALVDISGNVKERYEYDAYGQPTIWDATFTNTRETSNYGNPYLFTGRRVDILDNSSLKIQYNRNRYYDYYTARWLTHDPLGITPNPQKPNVFDAVGQYKDGLNLYEYAKSSPIVVIDPMGTQATCPNNAPVGDPGFCWDRLNPHPAHWGRRCWREIVAVGCHNPGNQCCYRRVPDPNDPTMWIWVFDHESPDSSGPATGRLWGLCIYHPCNLCCHIRDDVL